MSVVETAVDEQEVTFLGSDVDADGGKLILTAGAPKVTGDDEERMLLALRRIVEPTCRSRSGSASIAALSSPATSVRSFAARIR